MKELVHNHQSLSGQRRPIDCPACQQPTHTPAPRQRRRRTTSKPGELNCYACGCLIIRDPSGGHFIEWCPLHAAAPFMHDALEAIVARRHGVFDNPALNKFGALSTSSADDIERIANAALSLAEGKP